MQDLDAVTRQAHVYHFPASSAALRLQAAGRHAEAAALYAALIEEDAADGAGRLLCGRPVAGGEFNSWLEGQRHCLQVMFPGATLTNSIPPLLVIPVCG